MLVKLGVDISRLARPVRRTLDKIEDVFQSQQEEAIITSTYEADHSPSSLHYSDEAIDLRNPRYNTTTTISKLKHALGKDFDIVQEGDHIHIEYDPETP